MSLRWFTRLDGERVLQVDTMYGWQDVEEVREEDEVARERMMEERAARRRIAQSERAALARMAPHLRRAMKDFKPE